MQDHALLSHVLESLKSMREANDPADIDAENFYRLVLIVRAIAVSRPHNLAKFAEQYANKSIDESSGRYTFRLLMFLKIQDERVLTLKFIFI